MSNNTRRVNLDLALQAGSTSLRSASIGALALTRGGAEFSNATTASKTVISGLTYFHPNLEIQNGHIFTVSSGGLLLSAGYLTIVSGGSLVVNSGGEAITL